MSWIEVTHILEMIRRDTGPFDPYVATEQMLALCKSQIPTDIVNRVMVMIRE